MNTRLATVAPELVDWAESLSPSRRKTLASAIARWACDRTDVAQLLGAASRQPLLHPDYSATPQDLGLLGSLADELDERYLHVAEQDDVPERALRWFEQARALSALRHSFEAQELPDLCDTLYEAQAVTDDLEAFCRLCRTL